MVVIEIGSRGKKNVRASSFCVVSVAPSFWEVRDISILKYHVISQKN